MKPKQQTPDEVYKTLSLSEKIIVFLLTPFLAIVCVVGFIVGLFSPPQNDEE